MDDIAGDITEKIRAAAASHVHRNRPVRDTVAPALAMGRFSSTEKLVIVGASTGGTEALKDLLLPMPADAPAVLVAQHMPEGFTRSFANRLDGLCRMRVQEAEDGERVLSGHVYIAPGHSHLLLKKNGAYYQTSLSASEPVNRHRPSVDVLFRSAAQTAGKDAVGVILTGMGKDGATGLLEMKNAGAYTFAQDEASCVVFGMPKAAIEMGGANEVVPLSEMAGRVLSRLAEKK
jgi:two-component system chemotaxis response regulator CheB